MYKNSEKIDELKAEFEKLQQSKDCEFAPNIDGFIDFLAEKIIKLNGEVRKREERERRGGREKRKSWERKRGGGKRGMEIEEGWGGGGILVKGGMKDVGRIGWNLRWREREESEMRELEEVEVEVEGMVREGVRRLKIINYQQLKK